MNAVGPAQLAFRVIDVQPTIRIWKFGMNDLARDFRCPATFNWRRIRQFKKEQPRTPLLDGRYQLLNSLYARLHGNRRIFRVRLLECACGIDMIVEITGRLLEQLTEGERDLHMIKWRMKPILIGRHCSPDRTEEQQFGAVRT